MRRYSQASMFRRSSFPSPPPPRSSASTWGCSSSSPLPASPASCFASQVSSEGSAAEQLRSRGGTNQENGDVEARDFWNGPLPSSDLYPLAGPCNNAAGARRQAAGSRLFAGRRRQIHRRRNGRKGGEGRQGGH